MRIRLVVTGRSYHTTEHLPEALILPERATVDDAIGSLAEQLPPGEQLPSSCLVAVSGEHLGTLARHENRQLADGDELTLIAPVAGG